MRTDITQPIGFGSTAFKAVGLGRRARASWVLARVTQAPLFEAVRETDP
jgi:hypothetical protein